MADRIRIDIIQDGQKIAGVEGESVARVLQEAAHYAFHYEQDGPVAIKVRTMKAKRNG